jgi:aminoglycoside 3'-phosphotransferase-2
MSLLYPVSLDHLLSGYACDRNHIGRSPSEVFRLELEGSPTLYLKREAHGPFSELSDEAARLRWLHSLGLPCPAVVAHVVEDGHDWLVTSALPGRDLACETALPPFERVVLLALALRRLHSVDIACCPFDHGWQKRLAVAERRMRAGLIDEGDFDVERLGQSAAGLFSELGELTVTDEDLVVTHGDACLPNFIALDGAFSGYIDCGRLGVADRYQDIALACRSIEKNFGAVFVQPFCDHYGSGLLDTRKMKRYQLLDEFF